jgi:hypothetical protein
VTPGCEANPYGSHYEYGRNSGAFTVPEPGADLPMLLNQHVVSPRPKADRL